MVDALRVARKFVGGDDRAYLEGEPHVMAIEGTDAEFQEQPAATLVEHAVERGAEPVAIERMQDIEPARRGPFQRAAFEA